MNTDFFEKFGFDCSSEPYKKTVCEGQITIYKNYLRDGSGNYDGYIIVKPSSRTIHSQDEFMAALAECYF